MDTKNKKALQDHTLDLSKKIEDLTKRKSQLEKELSQSTAAIEERSKKISAAMLAGADSTKDQEANRHEKARADDMRGAITLAEKQIEELAGDLSSTNTTLYMDEIFIACAEFEKQMLSTIQKLNDAVASMKQVDSLYLATLAIGSKYRVNVDQLNETQQALHVYRFMESRLFGGDGINHLLNIVEDGHKNYLKDAREKFNA